MAIVAIFVSATSVHAAGLDTLISDYPGSELVDSNVKSHAQYQMIESKIDYLVGSGKNREEGYLPERTSEVEGKVYRAVYDYGNGDTALRIRKEMENELLRKGFSVTFSCRSLQCGDIAGWQLYFSPHVEGDIERQHYLVATRSHANERDLFVAFYVNEFSGRPRSITHIIDTQKIPFNRLKVRSSLEKTESVYHSDESGDYILFAFDSAVLSSAVKNHLASLAKDLAAAPARTISLEGYADSDGDSSYNLALSESRARAVFNFLVNKGVDPKRISVTGYGESQDNGAQDRGHRRRVDIR